MMQHNLRLDALERSGIRRFTALAAATPGCAKLTIGEPDFDTPAPICQAAADAMFAGQTHYSANQGTPELRKAIAEFETARGMNCTSEQVLVTVGATEALFTAMVGVLNPGDEVVIPVPAFPLYESIAKAAGAKIVLLDLAETGFQLTKEALDRVITPKTRAIILNSPNNPTGSVLSKQSLDAVEQAVAGKPIWVICDNVYCQLAYGPCPDLTLREHLREQIILCQSFSKPYAMTGWRLGYLVAPEGVMDRLLLLHAANVASIPTFVQTAGVTALQQDVSPMRQTYAQRREYVLKRLTDMGLTFPEPGGAFYVFPDIRPFGLDDETFCIRMIQEGGLAAVPGSCFHGSGHIRLSYCYSMEDLCRSMDRLEAFIRTLYPSTSKEKKL